MSGRKPVGLFGLNIFFAWSKSAADGYISIGGVSKDKVRHAVRLGNKYDTNHYISLDSSGSRISSTTIQSPKGITIKTGQTQDVPGASTMTIQVEHGNLDIDVQDGDFNVTADNFTFKSAKLKVDPDGKPITGNISFDSSNQFKVVTPNVKINSSKMIDLSSNNVLRLFGDRTTEIISGICSMQSWSTRAGAPPDLFAKSEAFQGGISEEENRIAPGDNSQAYTGESPYQSVEQFNALSKEEQAAQMNPLYNPPN